MSVAKPVVRNVEPVKKCPTQVKKFDNRAALSNNVKPGSSGNGNNENKQQPGSNGNSKCSVRNRNRNNVNNQQHRPINQNVGISPNSHRNSSYDGNQNRSNRNNEQRNPIENYEGTPRIANGNTQSFNRNQNINNVTNGSFASDFSNWQLVENYGNNQLTRNTNSRTQSWNYVPTENNVNIQQPYRAVNNNIGTPFNTNVNSQRYVSNYDLIQNNSNGQYSNCSVPYQYCSEIPHENSGQLVSYHYPPQNNSYNQMYTPPTSTTKRYVALVTFGNTHEHQPVQLSGYPVQDNEQYQQHVLVESHPGMPLGEYENMYVQSPVNYTIQNNEQYHPSAVLQNACEMAYTETSEPILNWNQADIPEYIEEQTINEATYPDVYIQDKQENIEQPEIQKAPVTHTDRVGYLMYVPPGNEETNKLPQGASVIMSTEFTNVFQRLRISVDSFEQSPTGEDDSTQYLKVVNCAHTKPCNEPECRAMIGRENTARFENDTIPVIQIHNEHYPGKIYAFL